MKLLGDYEKLVNAFLNKNYIFINYDELDLKNDKQVILRHDVDVSIDLALKMAILENNSNIQSTYFFLLSNLSYNLLADENIKKVKKIRKLGHNISLHFDLSIYQNPRKGFINEKKIFEDVFDENINIISIHQPTSAFLDNPENYFPIQNTYENKLLKKIVYFADSGGSFRYGSPLKSKAFQESKNIQLCIHPVWWMNSKKTVQKTIEEVSKSKSDNFIKHIKSTIKTFN
tara:strand:- start:2843 stop:3532 length:690 start_codon:yes stop_codon:yes gene_type:complete